MTRVLIADELSPAAIALFEDRGIPVDVRTGLAEAELCAIVGGYDGLAVRSATRVTAPVLSVAIDCTVKDDVDVLHPRPLPE